MLDRDPKRDPAVGDVLSITKKEGTLSFEVVATTERTVQYRTIWDPLSVAQPRLCDPCLLQDWRNWMKKCTVVTVAG